MGMIQVMQSLLNAQPHKETVVGTNGIATFGTDFKAPMKVVIPFEPEQEGTGDPSPDNVRPISGWTGCNIKDSKDSFYKTDGTDGVSSRYGVQRISNDSIRVYRITGKETYVASKQLLSVYNLELGKTYCISADATIVSGTARISIRNSSNSMKKFSEMASSVGNHHIELIFVYDDVEELNYLSFFATFGETSGGDVTYSNIKFAEVESIPITFTDPTTGDPMTVYGGTVTLNEDGSADVVAQHWILRDMSKFSSIVAPSASSGLYAHTFNLKNWATTWDKAGGASNMYCEVGVVRQRATNYSIWGTGSTSDMYFYDNTISTVAEFKAKYAGYYILYRGKGANKSYHFDNIGQLKSFLGTNNVWSDLNGGPTVTFWKHG